MSETTQPAALRANAFVHVGLCVTDLARSQRFYVEGLGFTFDRELRMPSSHIDPLLQLEPKGDIHAIYLRLDGFTLELMQFDPPGALGAASRVYNQTGLTHLALAVDDPDASADRCVALGGSIFTKIGAAAVVRDPDGQLVELVRLAFNDEIEAGRAARAVATGAVA